MEFLSVRFTFRVVGDHIGDRSYWIKKPKPYEPVQLVREPQNKFDSNAILVCHTSGKQLGYLKEEVAAWFARLLERGQKYTAARLRIRSDGGLIVAVYDA